MRYKNINISVCLTLIVLLTSSEVFAEKGSSVSPETLGGGVDVKAASDQSDMTNVGSVIENRLWIGPGDPVAGKSKAALCFGCHGEDGNSVEPTIPKLSGQFGIYISKQVRNFQGGVRSHQMMSAIAITISDEDLADISAYFASQPMMKGASLSSNKLGKNLFENGDLSRMIVPCNNCHGPAGKGKNPRNPMFPVIGGQYKEYLRSQLANFRTGNRSNSPSAVMNITVQKLSDAEIEALVEYISGL